MLGANISRKFFNRCVRHNRRYQDYHPTTLKYNVHQYLPRLSEKFANSVLPGRIGPCVASIQTIEIAPSIEITPRKVAQRLSPTTCQSNACRKQKAYND